MACSNCKLSNFSRKIVDWVGEAFENFCFKWKGFSILLLNLNRDCIINLPHYCSKGSNWASNKPFDVWVETFNSWCVAVVKMGELISPERNKFIFKREPVGSEIMGSVGIDFDINFIEIFFILCFRFWGKQIIPEGSKFSPILLRLEILTAVKLNVFEDVPTT